MSVRALQARFAETLAICLFLIAGSVTLIPIALALHPPARQIAHEFLVPGLPTGTQFSTAIDDILEAAITPEKRRMRG